MDETSLPNIHIINAIHMDPWILFVRRSNILITCAQSSVKPHRKWPELNGFHALGKIIKRNHNYVV